RREDLQGPGRGSEEGRVGHRYGLRRGEGLDLPHRPHGRPLRGRPAGPSRPHSAEPGMSIRVVIADKLGDAGIALLASSPEIHVVNLAGKPKEELDQALTTATALIVRSETRVTAEMIDHAPNLKVVARA